MKNIYYSFYISLILSFSVSAESFVQGYVSGNWNQGGSPYYVEDDILVHSDSSLMISSGVEVIFTGHYTFQVNGLLEVQGTAQDSVYFTAQNTSEGWGGIRFINSEPGSIAFAVIENGNLNGEHGGGIFISQANAVISNSTFRDNTAEYGGAVFIENGQLTVNECDFYENTAYQGAGISADNSSVLQVNGGNFIENIASLHGGGIFIIDSNGNIQNVYFEGNRGENDERGKGGAVSTQNATVNISNSVFTGNFSGLAGGAIGYVSSQGNIDHCLMYDNFSASQGGAIQLKWSDANVTNCTIDDNSAVDVASAIYATRDSYLNLRNSSVTNNQGPNVLGFVYSDLPDISFNNFYGNEGDIFAGDIPPQIGIINSVNSNGDSSDVYSNIYLPPVYESQANRNYNLLSSSPLIDAGDGNDPFDPDFTITDIGAFYFEQGSITDITVSLTPSSLLIIIPANGGFFEFNIEIANNAASPTELDVWTFVTLPNGSKYGPIINYQGLNLNAGQSVNRDRTQDVPGSAPAGNYTYDAYIGIYPNTILHEDHFEFGKSEVDNGGSIINGWNNWGEEFDNSSDFADNLLPTGFSMLSAYPNPFNPTTSISFELYEAANVALSIFDVNGRVVVNLNEGFKPAGLHKIEWRAEGFANGVYFAWLSGDGFSHTMKLLLVK